MAEIDRQDQEEVNRARPGKKRAGGASGDHLRRTEAEEDRELLESDGQGGSADVVFRDSPAFIHGGKMRDYQVSGLNWLISLHENGISGILADEMGLGKTLQTIALIGYLRHLRGVLGPHLIVVPKTTLHNWLQEFKKWTPDVNVLVLQGAKEERQLLIHDRLVDERFDVCITSYEMVLREKQHLKRFAWEYIIVDEVRSLDPDPYPAVVGVLIRSSSGTSDQERTVGSGPDRSTLQITQPTPDHRHSAAEQPARALGAPQLLAPGRLQQLRSLRRMVLGPAGGSGHCRETAAPRPPALPATPGQERRGEEPASEER